MEAWQWILAGIGVLAAVFVFGSIIWGIFDVLREDRLDQTTRALWLVAMFILPLFGVIAWLYFMPRLGDPHEVNLKNPM